MGARIHHHDLVDAVGFGVRDRHAIVRAINWLPARALSDYLGKLQNAEQRPGILHELRVIGKLLRLDGIAYRVVPPADDETFDALLNVGGREIEVEITAEIEPRFERSVRSVCEQLEVWLAQRYPEKSFHVRLSNDEDALSIRADNSLDEAKTFERYRAELVRAIDDSGAIAPPYRDRPRGGPIASIESSERTTVYQGVADALPGNIDVERNRRTLKRKTDRPQWTGARPAVLAVVLEHDPTTTALNIGSPSVCDEAFARVPYLAAIAGLPFANLNAGPVVFLANRPGDPHELMDPARAALARSFRFLLGVHWRQGLADKRRNRDRLRERGEWPPWRGRRLY